MDNLVLYILSGPPGSGKTTWREKMIPFLNFMYDEAPIIVISKDIIRDSLFGKKYEHTEANEKLITNEFYKQLSIAASFRSTVVIIDNTHCEEKHINNYLYIFKDLKHVKIIVEFFNVPLWKAYWRCAIRYLRTGRWVPFYYIRYKYECFKRINQDKYKQFNYFTQRDKQRIHSNT